MLKDLVAVTHETPLVPMLRVLIAHTDQLHNFVQQIPFLAWELLEYAQEPLEIIYPKRKDALRREEDPPEICVRWVKQPRLLRCLQKTGPLWAVLAPDPIVIEAPAYEVVDCYDRRYKYQHVKTIAIATDGTFSFLR